MAPELKCGLLCCSPLKGLRLLIQFWRELPPSQQECHFHVKLAKTSLWNGCAKMKSVRKIYLSSNYYLWVICNILATEWNSSFLTASNRGRDLLEISAQEEKKEHRNTQIAHQNIFSPSKKPETMTYILFSSLASKVQSIFCSVSLVSHEYLCILCLAWIHFSNSFTDI